MILLEQQEQGMSMLTIAQLKPYEMNIAWTYEHDDISMHHV